MRNKSSDVDNDFDKTSGEGGERISRSEFSIKGDSGIYSFQHANHITK